MRSLCSSPVHHLLRGKLNVHQVLAQGARQGAADDAEDHLGLLLVHQSQGLVELGDNLPVLVDVAAPDVGDAVFLRPETAAELSNFFSFIAIHFLW